jgi:hypothetical protein
MTTGANAVFQSLVPLETQRIFTALGMRFWDFALDRTVADGLSVSAVSPVPGLGPVAAVRTLSGVYAFHGLPGLRDIEYPRGDSSPITSPPHAIPFVIVVSDLLRRYLPQVFTVDLPLPYRGLFLSNEVTSPPGAAARAYLFSASTRGVPSGCATIRGQLWNKTADAPAAYAALQVTVAGNVWTGIADEKGTVALFFPYPILERLSLGSPPGSGQGNIYNTTWPVAVQVRYQPSKLRFPLAASNLSSPWPATPSLKSILNDQSSATIWNTEAGPPTATNTATLQYGVELVLRTGSILTEHFSGSLLVTPGP